MNTYVVPLEKGLSLLKTAWDIMGDINFQLSDLVSFNLKTLFFGVIIFDLLGVLVYHIWGGE